MKITALADLSRIKEEGLRRLYPSKIRLTVGMATCGLATGAQTVHDFLTKNPSPDVTIVPVGCIGFCQEEPIVDVLVPGMPRVTFTKVNEEKIQRISARLAAGKFDTQLAGWRTEEDDFLITKEKKRLTNGAVPESVKTIAAVTAIPFFKHQMKIALRNCGFINPEDIDEYIARGGYLAMHMVLAEMKPEDVIHQVKTSGLRGRGGAGFPTGLKWEICHNAKGDLKYLICNADEGDPGAYMDRSILEGDPHSVIEGMVIGAYAIGASEGHIYVRTEYPLAIERFAKAIKDAEAHGLLGQNILGKGFSFRIRISQGAGAFVCGEETSLIASIEGRPPEPRLRPPFPAQSGLWGKPTNINNVETWANVPVIIAQGGDWFARIGTEKSKGTKVFSLVGKITNTGLIEVPMGIPLEEILEMGGGIPDGRKFKAIQTGGPSGGCIPRKLINLPVDYEKLAEAGSIMGSGGMIVMDERTCMVDVAKYFLEFLKDESCGKCSSCREGTQQMYEIVKRITEGMGVEGDVALLENLGNVVKSASMCGLGQTAANPVLSTIKYFRDEYEAHIKDKRCPAVVCKEIVSSPCQHTCPIDTEAPAYIAQVARGDLKAAHDTIRKDNPLAAIVSRVCNHPCENKCRAGDFDAPINIRALKRFVTDWAMKNGVPVAHPAKAAPTGLKVAVVGSGPAGLTAAYYLALKGHGVTIFEAQPRAGGMPFVGIPEYRLPRAVLEYDVARIKEVGVEITTGTTVGRDLSIDDIFARGYKAIFIAIGAYNSLKLGLPDEDVAGIHPSMKFLEAIHTGKQVDVGKKVAVIGGGNSAIDAARVAKRLGADVTIVYRRTRHEMPAFKEEVDFALAEGINIHFLAAPTKVHSAGRRLTGIECIRMELGAPDESGRRRPVPIKGSEFTIALDSLIVAISEEPETAFLKDKIKLTKWNTIEINKATFQTSHQAIFAAGDVIRGPSTVIEAIQDGKFVAESIDAFLRQRTWQRDFTVTRPTLYVPPLELSEDEVAGLKKMEMPEIEIGARVGSFQEVELGYAPEMAVREAKRCLHCEFETCEGRQFLAKLKGKA